MTKQEIIDYANDFTEHKADQKIDMQRALELRISKFLLEKEFWFRRRVCKFQTTAAQALYDMGALNPPVLNVQRISKMRVLTGQASPSTRINPEWDQEAVMDAQEDPTQGPPTGFTVEPGTTNTIRVIPIPDQAYTLKFSYLGAYQIDATQPDFSAYVPEYAQFAVQDGLIMDIMFFLYGPQDERFAAALQEYQNSVSKFLVVQDFTSERVDTFVGDSVWGDCAVSSAS